MATDVVLAIHPIHPPMIRVPARRPVSRTQSIHPNQQVIGQDRGILRIKFSFFGVSMVSCTPSAIRRGLWPSIRGREAEQTPLVPVSPRRPSLSRRDSTSSRTSAPTPAPFIHSPTSTSLAKNTVNGHANPCILLLQSPQSPPRDVPTYQLPCNPTVPEHRPSQIFLPRP